MCIIVFAQTFQIIINDKSLNSELVLILSWEKVP